MEGRELADIVDLSAFADGEFDAVVCYGGPLSHVMDRADQALEELLRVTKPGGHVLLGVMSLHGSLHAFLAGADAEIEEFGIDEMQAIVETRRTADRTIPASGHLSHMFSWAELRALLERHDCDLVVASAANFLSIGNDEICERWLHDEVMWERFLGWEITSCAQPGAIDGGTHIIAVIRAR